MALIDHRWRKQLRVGWRFLNWRKTPPWPGFGSPFNGQRERLRAIRALVGDFEPDAFVETGTFLGHTTRFFAGNGVPVYTVEVKPSIYAGARVRLAWDPDIRLIRADSSSAVEDLAAKRPFGRPFAYLDAHWWDDLPLPNEVAVILSTWPDALIAIDDFYVPDDDGYGYDLFKGDPLSLDMLHLPEGVIAAFPAVSSSQETGGKRGTVYIAQGEDACVALNRLVDAGTLKLAASAAVATSLAKG